MVLVEDLAVLSPAADVDQGSEVVGHNHLGFADLVNSGNTSQLGHGPLSSKGGNSTESELFLAVGEFVSFLSAFGDLHDNVEVLGGDASGQDAQNTGRGEVLFPEGPELSDLGGQVLELLILKVDVLP